MECDGEKIRTICEGYNTLNPEEKREVIKYICKLDCKIFSVFPRNNLTIQENPFRKEARDY